MQVTSLGRDLESCSKGQRPSFRLDGCGDLVGDGSGRKLVLGERGRKAERRADSLALLFVSGSTFQPGLSPPLPYKHEGQGLYSWLNYLAVILVSDLGVFLAASLSPCCLSKPLRKL